MGPLAGQACLRPRLCLVPWFPWDNNEKAGGKDWGWGYRVRESRVQEVVANIKQEEKLRMDFVSQSPAPEGSY